MGALLRRYTRRRGVSQLYEAPDVSCVKVTYSRAENQAFIQEKYGILVARAALDQLSGRCHRSHILYWFTQVFPQRSLTREENCSHIVNERTVYEVPRCGFATGDNDVAREQRCLCTPTFFFRFSTCFHHIFFSPPMEYAICCRVMVQLYFCFRIFPNVVGKRCFYILRLKIKIVNRWNKTLLYDI